jgi:uncharacterized protein with beta-barrel porin domain
MLGAAATVLAMAASALAADVNVASNVSTGINLDTFTGSTVEVFPGVSVTNSSASAIAATVSAWALTNRGTVSATLADTVSLSVAGSSVTNFSSITGDSGSNAITLANGGSVDNRAGATISAGLSAITIGTFGSPGTGTVTNAGTITQTAAFGGDVVALLSGGTVTNLQGGNISGQNGGNAVSVGQGNTRTVINSGTITNTGTGFATGVLVQGGASTVINNATGRISGTFNGVFSSSDGPLALTNNGVIESTGADASARAVEADAGGTVVNTGTIRSASSDGLYLGDASTITNSGTISGKTLAINFANGATNTLVLDTGSVLNGSVQGGSGINNLVLLGTGAEDIGKFLNFQTLSMQGNAWTLGGNGTLSTSATIQSGTLFVNGQLTSPLVTVQSGGTLGGIGSIVGATTVASGGTLAPGSPSNPAGTLAISGNLAFQSGAIYLVQVTPSATASTNVSGTATLTGATVKAQFASGNYVSKRYTILTAAGGLGGTTFAGVANGNLPQGASDNLSYDANNVYLNLKAGFTTYTGLNVNQQNVANALTNFFNTTSGIPAAFFGLSPGGLTQIDGEAGTGAERAAIQLTNQFLELMLDPFVNGRANVGASGVGGGAIGFAPEQEASLPPDVALAYASIINKAPSPAAFEQRWTAWGSAFGGSNRANGDPTVGSNNITASTFGFAGGMDYHLSPTTIVGFALAGAGTNWGLANALGSGRSDAFQAGGYGISWFGPAYVAGALAFTNHWFNTSRAALGDQLSANFVGQSYGARLESGYRVGVLPVLGLTPYGAVQFQDFHTPAYSESDPTGGGFGLTYNAMNATDVRTELGSRFDAPTLLYGRPLVLYGRAAWAHDFVNSPALSAVFQTLPGAGFTVNGAAIPHDSTLTTVGAQWFITPCWTLLAKFDGEFGNGSQTYAGSGTLRYTW